MALSKSSRIAATAAILFSFSISLFSQTASSSPEEMLKEVENYLKTRIRESALDGSPAKEANQAFIAEKQYLAAQYANKIGNYSALDKIDLYRLARLYEHAENHDKALETYRLFLSRTDTKASDAAEQWAKSRVVIFSAAKKEFPDMEAAYFAWIRGTPANTAVNILLVTRMAAAYYEGGLYDQAIRKGKNAMELIKTLEAKTWEERRQKTLNYIDLIETLAMSYQKTGKPGEAANIIAEGRDLAFGLPSASLYYRIKTLAAKAGFKDIGVVNAIPPTGPHAPDLAISEWLGAPPASLGSYRGKVVLLDFWATWCGPCISSFPKLRDLQSRYGPRGFVILGVTHFEGKKNNTALTRQEELKYLLTFKEKHDLQYPIAISEASDTGWSKFGISAIPTTFLIDRRGIVRHIGVGSGKEEAARLEEMIKRVVGEQ